MDIVRYTIRLDNITSWTQWPDFEGRILLMRLDSSVKSWTMPNLLFFDVLCEIQFPNFRILERFKTAQWGLWLPWWMSQLVITSKCKKIGMCRWKTVISYFSFLANIQKRIQPLQTSPQIRFKWAMQHSNNLLQLLMADSWSSYKICQSKGGKGLSDLRLLII